ncbi:MAG TPA: hypothetical protein VJK51_04585 [Candidatus Nanoarchaeia archaeon]|nr:hypothetical protein [Candidatus Nanoarchaeia archaeon]
MAKIYYPEHFRKASINEIKAKIEQSLTYVCMPSGAIFGNPSLMMTTVYPLGHSLWDGRRVIIGEQRFRIIQTAREESKYDMFNKETIEKELSDLIGEPPSSHIVKPPRASGNYFSVVYDQLVHEDNKSVRIGRTRLVILPSELLKKTA